jgi:hypothetical protein
MSPARAGLAGAQCLPPILVSARDTGPHTVLTLPLGVGASWWDLMRGGSMRLCGGSLVPKVF